MNKTIRESLIIACLFMSGGLFSTRDEGLNSGIQISTEALQAIESVSMNAEILPDADGKPTLKLETVGTPKSSGTPKSPSRKRSQSPKPRMPSASELMKASEASTKEEDKAKPSGCLFCKTGKGK